MRGIIALSFLAVASPALAATYLPTEASKHIGESATIEGLAHVYISKGGTVFIDLGGYGREAPFSGVIFKDKTSAIANVTSLDGKMVDITGVIKTYRGKPEIIISEGSQLRAK